MAEAMPRLTVLNLARDQKLIDAGFVRRRDADPENMQEVKETKIKENF